uniref:Uncharacterized protein n=1 Tax=Caenorhabditis japonica TaxID=281687 RepID=A0A8R1E9P5_CAEJA
MINQEVKLPWHAGYCVFDPRQGTMSCYKQEYIPYLANRMIHRNNTVRLDGGRVAFAKHWGLLPDHRGVPLTGSHTIARSYTRTPKERIPTKERFFSISRIPSRFTKYSTIRALPAEYLASLSFSFPCLIAPCKTSKPIPSTTATTTSSSLKPRSPIERRVSASSHSSTGSINRGIYPNALHHLLLANKKRSKTIACANPSTPRTSSYSSSAQSSVPLYVNTAELLPKTEKRVSFKDLDISGHLPAAGQQLSSSSHLLKTGGGLHARKLHRCDTGDMRLLERYLSRENMNTPSPIPSEPYSPRHVHFAQNQQLQQHQSRRPFQRNESSSFRKRLSKSCDQLNDHNFSPRLPPIRRRPTKHIPSALTLVIHESSCVFE